MQVWDSAVWGLAGGAAAGLASLMVTVTTNGFKWWERSELWPRLFVITSGLLLGAIVAAAASNELSGPWPAFAFGVGAPSTIRGLLSGIEVEPAHKPGDAPRRNAKLEATDHHPEGAASESVS